MNKPTICQKSHVGNAFRTATHQRNNSITCDGKHVQFKIKHTIARYQQHDETTILTYDSGADGHYLSEKDRITLGLPILRISDKKLGVTNGGAYNGKYVTTGPFLQLTNRAAEADTFE